MSAESYATGVGGTLAAINSAQEETFLVATFLNQQTFDVPLWIGLQNSAPTKPINNGGLAYTTWATGEPVTYTDWNSIPGGAQEPNGGGGNPNLPSTEDYVAINFHNAFGYTDPLGTWDDLPEAGYNGPDGNANAQGPYYGIIEIVPEPTTNVMLGLGALAACAVAVRARRLQRAIVAA